MKPICVCFNIFKITTFFVRFNFNFLTFLLVMILFFWLFKANSICKLLWLVYHQFSCFTGDCEITLKGLVCKCLPQFTGRRCQVDLCNCSCPQADAACHCPSSLPAVCTSCSPNPCLNGGICTLVVGKPSCR